LGKPAIVTERKLQLLKKWLEAPAGYEASVEAIKIEIK
jgi:hypothetical protein